MGAPKLAILTIGDELLSGSNTDGNAQWLGQTFYNEGYHINRKTTVGDDEVMLLDELDASFQRSDIIILTGGLGPTHDDVTKHTLTRFFNTRLYRNEKVLNHITELFKQKQRPLREVNKALADVPENCTVLPNRIGTAPGMWTESNNTIVIALPGVPYEMKTIILEEALPLLKKRMPPPPFYYRLIRTAGIAESDLDARLSAWKNTLPDTFKLAYLPSPGQVKIHISASGNESANIQDTVEGYVNSLKEVIPELIYGYEEDSLPGVVGEHLRNKNQTLATAESCTGGAIAQKVTSCSGSSEYYTGSVIAYQNAIKENLLDVQAATLQQHGAVSEATVEEMALGVHKKFQTDYALSVSGIAGPSGGTESKPVGTVWIGLATPEGTYTRLFHMGNPGRAIVVEKTAVAALNLLRHHLCGYL